MLHCWYNWLESTTCIEETAALKLGSVFCIKYCYFLSSDWLIYKITRHWLLFTFVQISRDVIYMWRERRNKKILATYNIVLNLILYKTPLKILAITIWHTEKVLLLKFPNIKIFIFISFWMSPWFELSSRTLTNLIKNQWLKG